MDDLTALESDLQHVLDRPADRAVLDAVVSRLSPPGADSAWQVAEHEFGRLLVLAGLARALTGDIRSSDDLLDAADRYSDGSIYYTGRILPRFKVVLALVEQAVAERVVEPLVEAADHVSQGWPGYRDSAFPAAFQKVAHHLGLGADDDDFRLTSYTAWQSALIRAANQDIEEAHQLFTLSLHRYRRYGYVGDAAWLHTDVVLTHLLTGRFDAARQTLEEQRQFLDGIAAGLPETEGDAGAGGEGAVAIGVVRSGEYETFVESTSMAPEELSAADVAALRRYVTTSQRLIDFAAYGRRVDFEAALDLFTFGWSTYPSTPYPAIFGHLARAVAGTTAEADYLNPYFTAYHQWEGMLTSVRLPVDARRLWTMTVEIRERLQRAGFDDEAALVILDSALLRILVIGRAGVPDLLAVHREELRRRLPRLLADVTAVLAVPGSGAAVPNATPYLAHRAGYPVPDFLPALSACTGAPAGQAGAPPSFEVTLLGNTLSLNGVRLYAACPPGVRDVVRVLGAELSRARERRGSVPFLSADELAGRIGKNPAALAQTIRRFRAVCDEQLTAATGRPLPRDAVIQGRPGYRFNPRYVTRVVLAPSDEGVASTEVAP